MDKPFQDVSTIYHMMTMNQLVNKHNVFHYRELHIVYSETNRRLTLHSIGTFLSNLGIKPNYELENAIYSFLQGSMTDIELLYEKYRICQVKFVNHLFNLRRNHRVVFPSGDTIEGGRHGIILNDKDTYYPEHFSTLVSLLLQKLQIEDYKYIIQPACEFLLLFDQKHNYVRIDLVFIVLIHLLQTKFKTIDLDKLVMVVMHTPLSDLHLLPYLASLFPSEPYSTC